MVGHIRPKTRVIYHQTWLVDDSLILKQPYIPLVLDSLEHVDVVKSRAVVCSLPFKTSKKFFKMLSVTSDWLICSMLIAFSCTNSVCYFSSGHTSSRINILYLNLNSARVAMRTFQEPELQLKTRFAKNHRYHIPQNQLQVAKF